MYCKILPRDNEKGIKNTLEYVKDAEKCNVEMTIEQLSNELQNCKTDSTLHRTFNYAMNENKTINLQYITGYLCSPDTAEMDFILNIKKACELAGKETKDIQFYHMIQSFHEKIKVPNWEVNNMGIELVKLAGDEKHMALVSSHLIPEKDDHTGEIMGGACQHNHIVMCAYIHPDFIKPGQKQIKYSETLNHLRRCNDQVMLNHGLPIIIESSKDNIYYTVSPDFIKDSWKVTFKQDVEDAKRNAKFFKNFTSILEDKGYTVEKGKNTTLLSKDGHQISLERLGHDLSTKHIKKLYSVKSKIDISKKQKGSLKTKELEKIMDKHGTDLYVQLVRKRSKKKDDPDPEDKYYKMTFNLNSPKYQMLFDEFIDKNEVYEILIQKKKQCKSKTDEEYDSIEYEAVGAVSGEDLYHFHDLKVEKEKEQAIKEILKDYYDHGYNDFKIAEYKDEQGNKHRCIYNVKYKSYKTNKPYTFDIDRYFRYSRGTALDLILLFVIFLIAMYEIYQSSAHDNLVNEMYQKTSVNDIIDSSTNPKIKEMADAMDFIARERIFTFNDLNTRIKKAGARIGFIKKGITHNQNTLNEMKLIKAAIEYLDAFENMNDSKKNERRKVYAFLRSKNIRTESDRKRFMRRFESIEQKIENYKMDLEDAIEKYKNLKYIDKTFNLTNDVRYVFVEKDSLDIQKENLKYYYNKNADNGRNVVIDDYNDIHIHKHNDEYER